MPFLQLVKDGLFLGHAMAVCQATLSFGGQVAAVVEPLLGCAQDQARLGGLALQFLQFPCLGLRLCRDLRQTDHLLDQFVALGPVLGQGGLPTGLACLQLGQCRPFLVDPVRRRLESLLGRFETGQAGRLFARPGMSFPVVAQLISL